MGEVSVAAVIPLFNGEAYIREALQSVLDQTRPADEIIVVDDGSRDEGPRIVAEMAAHHPITLLSKENGGQSSARNLAIRHTRCTHVAFLDQDDAWYENHIETLVQPFLRGTEERVGIVYGNLDRVAPDGRMICWNYLDTLPSRHPKTSLKQCLEQDMFILPGATLAAREALLAAGLFDERLCGYEDDDLFVRLFSLGYRNIYVNAAVTRWRIHSGSTSFSTRMAQSRMIYFRKLIASYPDEPELGHFWGQKIIGPRFFRSSLSEFKRASRAGNEELMRHCWAEMQEILPTLKKGRRLWIGIVLSVANALPRGSFPRLAHRLLLWAGPRTPRRSPAS